jgi:hypothetical protein
MGAGGGCIDPAIEWGANALVVNRDDAVAETDAPGPNAGAAIFHASTDRDWQI